MVLIINNNHKYENKTYDFYVDEKCKSRSRNPRRSRKSRSRKSRSRKSNIKKKRSIKKKL